jgi:hypothetical protein
MKTKLFIIPAFIILNINLVSAHINSRVGVEGPTKSKITISVSLIAPITPAEATFEDGADVNPVVPSPASLAPVTPKDASFEEISSGEESTPTVLSPVHQKVQIPEKGKTVHPDFPLPCDARYGCSL